MLKFEFILTIILIFIVGCFCNSNKPSAQTNKGGKENMKKDINPNDIRKPSRSAYYFYEHNPEKLIKEIDNYLNNAPKDTTQGELVAIISPHAGYVYSGHVAAHSYKQVEGRDYNTVIVIASDHVGSVMGGVSVYNRGGYETPLGIIPTDIELANKIIEKSKPLTHQDNGDQDEGHPLEIQLPFLQRVIKKEFKIVPMVTSGRIDFGMDDYDKVATAIVEAIGNRKDVLLVASTDMTHFPSYDDAVKIDNATLSAIATFDPLKVIESDKKFMGQRIRNLSCTLCGLDPVIITMMSAKKLGATKVKILKYANSGDVPIGEKGRVVGYGAVAFYK